MPRYSPEQLKEMAQEWSVDRTAGGEKSFQVVMQLCLHTGLTPGDIVQRIERLASCEN